MFTKKMESVVAEEFGEAILEVEVSLEHGEVQWMRQGVVIHPGPKFTLKQSGCRRWLRVHSLTLSDRGTYSCETLHDRTTAQLNVERKIHFSCCCVFTANTTCVVYLKSDQKSKTQKPERFPPPSPVPKPDWGEQLKDPESCGALDFIDLRSDGADNSINRSDRVLEKVAPVMMSESSPMSCNIPNY